MWWRVAATTGAGTRVGFRRIRPDRSESLLAGFVERGIKRGPSMIAQEDVPLLSIGYFLLSDVVICSYRIQEWIVAVGSVSLDLSLMIDKVSKQIAIHFAAQLFGFTADLFPVRMLFVCDLPHSFTSFHPRGKIIHLHAAFYQFTDDKKLSIVHVHCPTAQRKLRPGDGQ